MRTSSLDLLKFGRRFRTQGIQFSLSDTTTLQFKGSLFGHRMGSGMMHEKSFFCRLDRVFVLEGGKLEALLDGTVHALYQSTTLRMVQCSSGVFVSTLSEIVLYLMGGKLNTVVRHNMVRVTLTQKYTLKTFYDTTSCNIGHKFNLAPFRKLVNEKDGLEGTHDGLEGTHDVHRNFLPRSFLWRSRGQWCLVHPVGFVTKRTHVAILDQVFNLFVESRATSSAEKVVVSPQSCRNAPPGHVEE